MTDRSEFNQRQFIPDIHKSEHKWFNSWSYQFHIEEIENARTRQSYYCNLYLGFQSFLAFGIQQVLILLLSFINIFQKIWHTGHWTTLYYSEPSSRECIKTKAILYQKHSVYTGRSIIKLMKEENYANFPPSPICCRIYSKLPDGYIADTNRHSSSFTEPLIRNQPKMAFAGNGGVRLWHPHSNCFLLLHCLGVEIF